MDSARVLCGLLALLLTGAFFGFFFAWTCSTMWGLDAADPRVAVAAMQAMNASVRNALFAPVFFGAGPLLMLASVLSVAGGYRAAAGLWALAAVTIAAVVFVTFTVHVPMNEALATATVPENAAAARTLWRDYSPAWQVWNQVRTVGGGVGLSLAALAFRRM